MSEPRTLGAVLYPDFELLDLYGPLEMFGSLGQDLRIVTVSDAPGPVASSPGVKTHADHGYADCPELDALLVPGGFGTFPQLANEALLGFLRARCPAAETTLSVCSGSALLAKAGLLDGRRATSNKLFFDAIAAQGEKVEWVTEARWVEDGSYVTSSGVSAGTDAALAVIANWFGTERAEQIAIYTEYTWHRDAATDPFARYLNDATIRDAVPPPSGADG